MFNSQNSPEAKSEAVTRHGAPHVRPAPGFAPNFFPGLLYRHGLSRYQNLALKLLYLPNLYRNKKTVIQ